MDAGGNGNLVHCAHCGRSRLTGDRWGSGTMDASGRVFCTYECAWTVLFYDEHRAACAAVPVADVPRQGAVPRRRRNGSTKSKRSGSKSTNAAALPQRDAQWHALLGMQSMLGSSVEQQQS